MLACLLNKSLTLNCSLRHGTELLNRKNKRDMNIANAKLGRSHTRVSLTFAYLLDKAYFGGKEGQTNLW